MLLRVGLVLLLLAAVGVAIGVGLNIRAEREFKTIDDYTDDELQDLATISAWRTTVAPPPTSTPSTPRGWLTGRTCNEIVDGIVDMSDGEVLKIYTDKMREIHRGAWRSTYASLRCAAQARTVLGVRAIIFHLDVDYEGDAFIGYEFPQLPSGMQIGARSDAYTGPNLGHRTGGTRAEGQ